MDYPRTVRRGAGTAKAPELHVIMTEDDTFNALKKMTFDQLNLLYANSEGDWLGADIFLETYGWTWAEYRSEWEKRQDDRR